MATPISEATKHHHNGAVHCDACFVRDELVAEQVAEIHGFISGLAKALENPMLKAMLPPQMRGMLGG